MVSSGCKSTMATIGIIGLILNLVWRSLGGILGVIIAQGVFWIGVLVIETISKAFSKPETFRKPDPLPHQQNTESSGVKEHHPVAAREAQMGEMTPSESLSTSRLEIPAEKRTVFHHGQDIPWGLKTLTYEEIFHNGVP